GRTRRRGRSARRRRGRHADARARDLDERQSTRRSARWFEVRDRRRRHLSFRETKKSPGTTRRRHRGSSSSTTPGVSAAERNRYRFSFQPNLNKLLADRRASVSPAAIDEYVRKEIQKVFAVGSGVERVYFPRKSSEVPDRPVLTLAVLPPENAAPEPATKN